MKIRNETEYLYTKRASLYEQLFVSLLGWGSELESFFRESRYVHPGSKVLDAGCGTGIITRVLYDLAKEEDYEGMRFHAFDLTHNMLKVSEKWIAERAAKNIELQQADVLDLESLPSYWRDYHLIVSSAMLEYLPKERIKEALANLKQLLGSEGTFLILMTKRNLITQWLAGKWWKTNLYGEKDIRMLLQMVGFNRVEFKEFSPGWSNFILVVEAKS